MDIKLINVKPLIGTVHNRDNYIFQVIGWHLEGEWWEGCKCGAKKFKVLVKNDSLVLDKKKAIELAVKELQYE
jgi:N-acetylglucosamine-6-phosphate deacetylase